MTAPSPESIVEAILADAGGDKDAAMLVLAAMLIAARGGMSAGFVRLPTR